MKCRNCGMEIRPINGGATDGWHMGYEHIIHPQYKRCGNASNGKANGWAEPCKETNVLILLRKIDEL